MRARLAAVTTAVCVLMLCLTTRGTVGTAQGAGGPQPGVTVLPVGQQIDVNAIWAGNVSASALDAAAVSASNTSYAFAWSEGAHMTMVEFWNAQSRVACEYAVNPWPQHEFAAERAFVLGARQVLRDEWNISAWIGQNRAAGDEARIHGAEDNCPNAHHDYPPHVHILDLTLGPNGEWLLTNSHHYPDGQGRVYENFVIPQICGGGASYEQPADAWLDILDETCTAAWQQRFTSAGDIQLRRNSGATVYALHITAIHGDLATLDVSANGSVIASVSVDQFDPLGMTMVASIKDYSANTLTTETWQGDPATGNTLVQHTVKQSPLAAATPAPTRTPAATPTRTATPTQTPVPAPVPAFVPGRRTYLPLIVP